MNSNRPSLVGGFLASLLAWSCTTSTPERSAGGEDFPNTLEALGRALAEGVDSSAAWNGLDEASTAAGSSVYPDSSGAIAGRLAVGECVEDSGAGLLPGGWAWMRSTRCADDGGILRDSMVIRPSDSLIRLFVQDSTGSNGLVRRLDIFRPDTGDGFRQKGWSGLVRIETIGIRGRWRSRGEVVLDAGPDLDWDTESDNRLWRGGHLTLRGSDTTDSWTVVPWPETGAPLWEVASGDSGTAFLRRKQFLPSGAVRTEGSLLTIFRHDSLNYPRRFHSETIWSPTLWILQSITGSRPDSSFRPGDTAIYLRRRQAAQDTLREEIRFLASPDPRDRRGDRLLQFRRIRFHSSSTERFTLLDATPAGPLDPGTPFTEGKVNLVVERADGEHLTFTGEMAGGIATGRWTSRTDSGTVVLDSRGRVLSTSR